MIQPWPLSQYRSGSDQVALLKLVVSATTRVASTTPSGLPAWGPRSAPGTDFQSCRRTMIVNDSPAGFCFPKQQTECPVRLVVRAFQAPAAQNQRGVFTKHGDFEI